MPCKYTERITNSGENQGGLLRGGGSNEPGKEGLRTGEGKGMLGRGSSMFQSPGLQESAVQGPARPRALAAVWPPCSQLLLHRAEGRGCIRAYDFCYKHTCNAIRFKCFQAGASQGKYLLAANSCGLEESSAGDGDAASNLITFLLPGGWVSVMNRGLQNLANLHTAETRRFVFIQSRS